MHWLKKPKDLFSLYVHLRTRLTVKKKRIILLIILSFVFSIFAIFTVSTVKGVPTTTWMNIYKPSDFKNFKEMLIFLKDLRIPIPPVFSIMEIVNFQLSGNYHFVTVTLYRLGLILVYITALILAAGSYKRMILTFFISLFFLWSTKIIHLGNPQVYDIYLPLFILLFLLFTKLAASERFHSGKIGVLFPVLSGLFLSMAELSRPYIFLFLPFLVIWAYFMMGQKKKRHFLYFLIPIILFSGVWHLKLLVFNNQLIWSNHSGFNLARCWVFVEKPPLIPEPGNTPTAPGRWKNLNTPEHLENSRRIQSQILKYIFRHPLRSTAHIFRRFTFMMSGPTKLYTYKPRRRYPMLYFYKFLVIILTSYLFINAFRLCILGFGAGRRFLKLFLLPENILILITLFSFVIFSISESGEESRLLISILPMLAIVPSAKTWKPQAAQQNANR